MSMALVGGDGVSWFVVGTFAMNVGGFVGGGLRDARLYRGLAAVRRATSMRVTRLFVNINEETFSSGPLLIILVLQ